MKGTFIHDSLMMGAMILLVFLLVYYTADFGMDKVERMMESSPKYIQQSIIGIMSAVSTYEGNVTVRLYADDLEMDIKNTDSAVVVKTDAKKYADLNNDGTTTLDEWKECYKKVGETFNPKTDPSIWDLKTNRLICIAYYNGEL